MFIGFICANILHIRFPLIAAYEEGFKSAFVLKSFLYSALIVNHLYWEIHVCLMSHLRMMERVKNLLSLCTNRSIEDPKLKFRSIHAGIMAAIATSSTTEDFCFAFEINWNEFKKGFLNFNHPNKLTELFCCIKFYDGNSDKKEDALKGYYNKIRPLVTNWEKLLREVVVFLF